MPAKALPPWRIVQKILSYSGSRGLKGFSVLFCMIIKPKPTLKIARLLVEKKNYSGYMAQIIFIFRNKTFLFLKIEN